MAIWLSSLFDIVLAEGGLALERVFMASMLTWLNIDFAVFATPPALDLGGLDTTWLDSDLI